MSAIDRLLTFAELTRVLMLQEHSRTRNFPPSRTLVAADLIPDHRPDRTELLAQVAAG